MILKQFIHSNHLFREFGSLSTRIVIIGAGPGGYSAAFEAARLGVEATLIEREALGGVCLNRGCIPTKTWKTAAEHSESIRKAAEYGVIMPGEPRLDPRLLLDRQRTVVDSLGKGLLSRLRKCGVRYLEGDALFIDPHHVRVRRSDGVEEEIAGDRLIIATGSAPLCCPSVPFDGVRVISTDEAVLLAEIPRSMLIVGGGVNGCEFASIFSSLGSKTTIVEARSRLLPLPSIDADSSKVLEREMKKRTVTVLLDRMVEDVSFPDGRIVARVVPVECNAGAAVQTRKPMLMETDLILVTVGRRPNADAGGLNRLGIETDADGWIVANERLETNVPGVYAIGDIRGPQKPMLAHVAAAEGIVAARNALGAREAMDYRVIPVGVFSTPEVAGVGLTETQARECGVDIRVSTVHLRSLGRAQAMGEIAGQVKMVADARGKILGVHIVGAHATDLIAEAALALKMGASAEDVASAIHAHPTLPEALRDAAEELRWRGMM